MFSITCKEAGVNLSYPPTAVQRTIFDALQGEIWRGEKEEKLPEEALNSKYRKCHARTTHWINEGSLKQEKEAVPPERTSAA